LGDNAHDLTSLGDYWTAAVAGPRLAVFDTEAGKPVADLAICGDTDDLFYDAQRKRIYISCGEGFIDVISQDSADTYTPLSSIQTSAGGRTCFFSPDLDCLYLAVPDRGSQKAEIRVYQPECGEKHWHGAAPKTAMTHIAIQEALDGKLVDWMEHVSDEQCGAGANKHGP
jgi:hypothetical protein